MPWGSETAPPDPAAVSAEITARLSQFLEGIEGYQSHPIRRSVPEPPVVWAAGSSRLLDYGLGQGGLPVLVLPSLINRAYVLDLAEDWSFLRFLAGQGLRPFLLDWGAPGPEERTFNLDRYVRERYLPALSFVRDVHGAPPALLGYCMGGTLAAGLAAVGPPVAALVTLGAPWQFDQGAGIGAEVRRLARSVPREALVATLTANAGPAGFVTPDLFDWLFAVLDPFLVLRKFRKFQAMPAGCPNADRFVVLEDWLADAVPMALPAATNVLIDWYIENQTGHRRWRLLDRRVDPKTLTQPALCVIGRRDHIAPPALSDALPAAMPAAETLSLPLGHVGMIASRRAPDICWRAVAAFLTRGV